MARMLTMIAAASASHWLHGTGAVHTSICIALHGSEVADKPWRSLDGPKYWQIEERPCGVGTATVAGWSEWTDGPPQVTLTLFKITSWV